NTAACPEISPLSLHDALPISLELLEYDVIRQVVLIEVTVTEGMDKLTHLQIALLGDHMSQQRIGRNVERNAQEQVGTALIQLARDRKSTRLNSSHVKISYAVF